jgi:hypothetical protein
MAASVCQAIGWGMAGAIRPQPRQAFASSSAAARAGPLLPAVAVSLLGAALAASGPPALVAVQATLSLSAVAGALFSLQPRVHTSLR